MDHYESRIEMMKLTLYHTGDLHDRRHVFSLLEKLPVDESTLFLDSGDALGGSNTLFYLREPIIALMNKMRYAAMAMGNREFHYLRGVLEHRHRSASFPILAANLRDRTGKVSHCWQDGIVLHVGEIKVAITGLTPVQFPLRSFLTDVTGFEFSSPREALLPVLEDFRNQGVMLVILLSHLGLADDVMLAETLEGIDLIIGGHSHTVTREPKIVGRTAIVHSGHHGQYIGRVSVNIDKGNPSSVEYQLIDVKGGTNL